ncbi:MAG TPA: hypothetical protein VFH68_17530 [Polyangia bacterium]|jgi:HPt (histidine-containing phosphotransfer) domain-containing protein|nr:hypothetical protein [Polyangia bacterium]
MKAKGSALPFTEAELRQIAQELDQSPDAGKIISAVGESLDALVPLLTELNEAFTRMK